MWRSLLFTILISLCVDCLLAGGPVIRKVASEDFVAYMTANAVGYWRLNEASGDLTDSTGNGNTLTANGTPAYSQTGLLPNDGGDGAILFDGGDYFNISSNLGITDYPVTITFAMTTTSNNDGVVWFGDTGETNVYMTAFLTNDTTQFISARAVNTSIIDTSGTETDVNTGSTFFVQVTWASATDREVWINGVSDGSSSTSVTFPTPDEFSIGRLDDSSPGNNFSGTLDEVAIFDQDLGADALTIYNLFNDN